MICTVPIHEHNDCHNPPGPGGGQFCGDGPKSGAAVDRSELEDSLMDDQGRAVDIPKALRDHGIPVHEELTALDGSKAWSVVLAPDRWKNNLFVVDDSGTVTEANEWVRGADPTDWYPEPDFNKEFWESPGTLYHATTSENADIIDKEGLAQMNKTRGLTNRWTGAAVFAHSDPEAIDAYGNVVFEIDLARMKADKYMPEVATEAMVSENELRAALAWKVGIEDWYDESIDPGGEDPQTVVIYGAIPVKYLKRMD